MIAKHIWNKQTVILLGACVVLAAVIGTASSLTPEMVPVIIGALLFPFLLLLPVDRFLLLIALCIFIDRSFLSVGGSYIRIYQVLFLFMTLKFALEMVAQKRDIFTTPLFLFINLWVGSYFLSYNHVLNYTDFWTVVIGQLFLNLFFFLSVQVIYDKGEPFLRKIVKYSIISGVIVAVVGFVQWAGFFLGVEIGISHYEHIGIPRPSSFAHEPDWYGLFCGYSAAWLLVLYMYKHSTLFSHSFIQVALVITCLGVMISMARAAILALFAAGLFLFILTKGRRLIRFALFTGIGGAILASGLFLTQPEIGTSIYQRMNPVTSLETDSGAADSRVASIQMMIDHINIHPIVGNGSGGMAELSQMQEMRDKYIYGGELNEGKGNANIFLTVLFDTGIIGLAIFLVIIGRLIQMIHEMYSKQDFIPLGFAASSIVILVDFNFNNGFRMGFVWFHLAMIAAYYMLYKKREVDRYEKGGG
ncbi:O-antigen ligase family protein [Halobacillus kuroshimensis]|uniref:O-antigen ligase family protein n=1 Tax=Halobacillus kuroshimensis TaxID=302481 RepID=UPI0004034F39|nr:O-antigen ligase family protein [Halobacillus kuroshimensis]